MATKTQITLRTNLTPALTFDPTKQDSRSAARFILNLLQPSIDGDVPILGNVHFAPYGEPKQFGSILAFVIVFFAVMGGYYFIKRGIE